MFIFTYFLLIGSFFLLAYRIIYWGGVGRTLMARVEVIRCARIRLMASTKYGVRFVRRSVSTHFGFKEVEVSDKQREVDKVFSGVAKKYDIMNDAMSFGLHRLWKNKFVNRLNPRYDQSYLDLAGGTGDIAFRIADKMVLNWIKCGRKDMLTFGPNGRIIVSDINESMIKEGQKRAARMNVPFEWIVSDASCLPLEAESVDAVTISFGLRNCAEPPKVLAEAFRVLKPGGRFMCLEFSQVENRYLSLLYDAYSFNVIPVMGTVIAGDWESYQYLVESIRVFYRKNELVELLKNVGFRGVQYDDIFNGMVCIHEGFK